MDRIASFLKHQSALKCKFIKTPIYDGKFLEVINQCFLFMINWPNLFYLKIKLILQGLDIEQQISIFKKSRGKLIS